MAASKRIGLVFGLSLAFYLAGIFGPGPLGLGLGPFFDQLVIFAVLALLALIAKPQWLRLFRKKEPSDRNESETSAAEAILRERYARGELDRNQYIVMLEDLRMPIPRKTWEYNHYSRQIGSLLTFVVMARWACSASLRS